MATADLLLHPIRLRILQAFLSDATLTTNQLVALLPDVPPASLYRHVGRLVRGGVLEVVAERPVRGAVERTYGLRALSARIGAGEAATMTPAQHSQAFSAYIAGMLADADRYFASGRFDSERDGADYRVGALWLNDDEFAEFVRDLAAVYRPRAAFGRGKGRRRRLLYGVVLPDASSASDHTEGD